MKWGEWAAVLGSVQQGGEKRKLGKLTSAFACCLGKSKRVQFK